MCNEERECEEECDEECDEDCDFDDVGGEGGGGGGYIAPATSTTTRSVPPPPKPAMMEVKPASKTESQENRQVDNKQMEVEEKVEDLTLLPKVLDKKFKELDDDAALRATIIKTGGSWKRKVKKTGAVARGSGTSSVVLENEQQETEKKIAFDLLDALSRSGSLVIDQAELHVVLAFTHCFDDTLLNTVLQKNVNPVEKVERSVLITASTILDKNVEEIVAGDQVSRVQTYSPKLFASLEVS